MKNDLKQRLTAFVDPALVTRAKVRGALEGLTISEIVEKSLEAYAPQIEKDADHHINLKFINGPAIDSLIPKAKINVKNVSLKHAKQLGVPRT